MFVQKYETMDLSICFRVKKIPKSKNDFGLNNKNIKKMKKNVPAFLLCSRKGEAGIVSFVKFHNFLLALKAQRIYLISILYILHYYCEQIKTCRKLFSRQV